MLDDRFSSCPRPGASATLREQPHGYNSGHNRSLQARPGRERPKVEVKFISRTRNRNSNLFLAGQKSTLGKRVPEQAGR
jgi:hypothetical protein